MDNNVSNDYFKDGKLYIKSIKRCFIIEKKGDNYILQCKIKQHGEKDYHYIADGNYLEYDVFCGPKQFWLSEDAKNVITESIKKFNDVIEDKGENGAEFCREDCGDYVIRYHRTSLVSYEVIKEIKEKDTSRYVWKKKASFEYFFLNGHSRPQDNALYVKAVKNNDLYVKYSVENLCGVLTKEGRLYLESVDGIKRLPCVKKCLDQTFYVIYEDGIWDTLYASNYGIFHRPCFFAMKGYTHSIIEINPYIKRSVDAAKKGNEAISWQDFCNVCEENAID